MQSYDIAARLGANGWMEMPEQPWKECSREQMAGLISRATARLEEGKITPVAEEYSRISRVLIMDEVQWKLAKEQESNALDRYKRAMRRAVDSGEKLRQDSHGEKERTEEARAEESQQAFQYAMRDYLQAGARTRIRKMILDADRRRQQALLEAISEDVQDLFRLQNEFLAPGDLRGKPSGRKQEQAKEAESQVIDRYNRTAERARMSQELLARRSVQGDNRLERMQPLMNRVESDQKEYQMAARDYAQARVNTAWSQMAPGEIPVHRELSLPLEKDTFFQGTGSAAKIMEDVARRRNDLRLRLSNSGYLEKSAEDHRQTEDSKALDAAEKERASALSRYRDSLEQAENSLGILRRNSWREVSPSGNLLALQEQAEHDVKKLQYASWEYMRAWMKVKWAECALGKNTRETERGVLGVAEVMETFSRLRAEFLSRCLSLKYLDEEAAEEELFSSQPVQEPFGKRFKIEGEVRLDSGHSTGEEGIGNRTRLRVRLYPDYNIDNNWHARGMLEYERTLSGREGSEDGKLRLARYYLEGNIGEVKTRAGVFGSYMAEGNIYDSKFKGVHFETGSPVRYAFEYGSMDAAKRAYNLTASYKGDGYKVEGGYYNFSDVHGATRQIYMGNYRKPLGAFDFGAMLLYGRDAKAGNGAGYVLSLSRGFKESWRAGNLAYWLKYYRQPSATYISHTMNGMADFMSSDALPTRGGFRGIGIGGNYTINPNLYFALEYYWLQDLATGIYSNTIWGALTGYFQEREE